MIDETGQAGAQNAVPAGKQINAKGNNDQWQRHLEKAYFERQRAAMQGQSPHEQPVAPSQRGTAGAPDPEGLTESDAAESGRHAATGNGHDSVPAAAASQTLLTAGGRANSARAVSAQAPAGSAAVAAQGGQAGGSNRSGDPVVVTQRALPAWRGTLPATSSASVLLSAQGAHLVIRDTSLSPDAARRLLGRLHALFAAEGQRLWALTLNGERLWQAPDHESAAHSAAEYDPGIDLQY